MCMIALARYVGKIKYFAMSEGRTGLDIDFGYNVTLIGLQECKSKRQKNKSVQDDTFMECAKYAVWLDVVWN